MEQIRSFLFGNGVLHYVTRIMTQMEAGFSEDEAKAMDWIASQKPKGKLIGFTAGSFLAFCWGHWHPRLQAYFHFRFSKLAMQSAIVIVNI